MLLAGGVFLQGDNGNYIGPDNPIPDFAWEGNYSIKPYQLIGRRLYRFSMICGSDSEILRLPGLEIFFQIEKRQHIQ